MGSGAGGKMRRRLEQAQVELIYFDAGGGHRASAVALATVLAAQFPGVRVAMVNLRERLDKLDYLRRCTGVKLENFYNALLRKGLAVGIGPMLRVLHLLVREMHPRMVRMLAEGWARHRPDLVVSLIPHFNRSLFEGLEAAARIRREAAPPLVTVMTDLADYPPHFWIEPQEQFLVCGTGTAARQALALGFPAHLILRSSGMIVRPEFYRVPFDSRAAERAKLGLEQDRPTGVVMFGGCGSRRMELIAEAVADGNREVQLIFACGRNDGLAQRLAARRLPYPHFVVGFTEAMPYFMRLADFFIGKPGPGSISEALVCGLPVIVERNRLTMPHERFNTDWLRQHQLGLVVSSFTTIDRAIAHLLEGKRLDHYRRRIAAHHNQAVFEIPRMLEAILEAGAPSAPRASLSA